MSILQNAIDSIDIGLEDYNSSDNRRLISCTRNIFAGILLLFKHKLSLLSPEGSGEVLIKQKVLPKKDANGNIIWSGQGKKTVNVHQIKNRFDSLGIDVDWERIEKINSFRNDIEHYYSKLSKKSAESLITNSFIVIRDFISIHLGEDPRELLSEESWNTLVAVAEVYDREKEECIKQLEKIQWNSSTLESAIIDFQCTECGSGLITVENPHNNASDNEYICRVCDSVYDFEDIATESLEQYYAGNSYRVHTEGETPFLLQCPYCHYFTYIYHEQMCAFCEESAEHECQRCSIEIPPEEISNEGFCSWCLHMMSKDD